MKIKINDGITPALKQLAQRVKALPKQITVTRPTYVRIESLGDPKQPIIFTMNGVKCLYTGGGLGPKAVRLRDLTHESPSVKAAAEHIRRQIAR